MPWYGLHPKLASRLDEAYEIDRFKQKQEMEGRRLLKLLAVAGFP